MGELKDMELSELRKQIDAIDDELVSLFLKRMDVSGEVAKAKMQSNTAVVDSGRERAIVSRLTKGLDDDTANYVSVLYSTIFEISRAKQRKMLSHDTKLADEIKEAKLSTDELFPYAADVAVQGVEGAYSQHACDRLFVRPDITYTENFKDVFELVDSEKCRYGVVPIENSLHGSVGEVYDLLKEYKDKIYIVRCVRIPIYHSLLAKKSAQFSDIKKVYSHSQAIGQCSEFLASHPDIEVNVCKNTAAAAKMVAESDIGDIAAISSADCAELYGLGILKTDIQNSDNNHTRFICISKKLEIYPGASKIGIMFTVKHKAGSLFNMLARFACLGVNLTKLESRPIKGRDFEFMFYAEMDIYGLSPSLLSFLCELDDRPEEFVFLGNYSEI